MTEGRRLRVAFLGTPDTALPSLDMLASIAEVALVVTQPDRPQGRSSRPQAPPVKTRAVELGLEVVQPVTSIEIGPILAGAGPLDVAVLVAFGQLVRPDALAVPAHGFLNVHFSILPRWRGAAPVQRAIMAGDDRVGVSVMLLEEGLDTGPVVATRSTGLGPREEGGAVLDRLAVAGARLVTDVLEPYVDGRLVATPQGEGSTVAAKITARDRRIDWSEPSEVCARRVRALAPRPGANTTHQGAPFKILRAEPESGSADPGVVIQTDGALAVGTGSGLLRLIEVQPAGRSPMSAADWARGIPGEPGRFE